MRGWATMPPLALIAPDGSIDWWCAPNMDSPPLFDRILDAASGGYFQIEPTAEYRVHRRYRENSNVLETCYETASGSVVLTESLNSNYAGRLPIQDTDKGQVIHIGDLMAMLRTSDDVDITLYDDHAIEGTFTARKGVRSMVALLVSHKEPLAVPSLEKIDGHIDISDHVWRLWCESLTYEGIFPEHVKRSALALKFLLYSPTGALAAGPTTSLPEGIGGEKNYDYRYACMIIRAFTVIGALEECKAAFSWLTNTILRHDGKVRVCYTLDGGIVPAESYPPLSGYKNSRPVRIGNNARDQQQLSMYGDLLATALLFVRAGHVLDLTTARLLAALANTCADIWKQTDSGIWELHDLQHYTHSKMTCWVTLDIAAYLAREGHLEATWVARWEREKTRIEAWIESNCWSEEKQAYTFYAGTDRLDASLCLTWHYGKHCNPQRMQSTLDAIINELGHGKPMLYRYSDVEQEESTFVACSFWLVEALAEMGDKKRARECMDAILETLCDKGNVETFNEMFDVRSGEWRGNVPQGLSHLALICAADALSR